MSIIYLDTSALLKRTLPEAESSRFVESLERAVAAGSTLVTSTLTRVEATRALRRRDVELGGDIGAAYRDALQSLAVAPITDVVIELARSIEPPLLRSLDAIHLATALAIGAGELWTYDDRLADATAGAGIAVRAPA
mgnify:CR=1 FL=1